MNYIPLLLLCILAAILGGWTGVILVLAVPPILLLLWFAFALIWDFLRKEGKDMRELFQAIWKAIWT